MTISYNHILFKNQRHLSTISLTSTKGKDHICKETLIQLLLPLLIVCKLPFMCLLDVKIQTPFSTLDSNPATTHPILLLHFTKRSLRGCPLRATSPGSIRSSQSSFLHCPTLPYLFRLCRKAEIGRQSFRLPGNIQLKSLAEND